jgi:hypothetical protein
LRQRVRALDLDLHDPGCNRAEQRVGAVEQLVAVACMSHEGRADDVKRIESIQLEQIEGSFELPVRGAGTE